MMTPLLKWRRPIVDRSPRYDGHRKLWPSACGRYRLVWRDAAYSVALPPMYHAMVCRKDGQRETWELLSRHRKRRRAAAACERHARCQR